MNKKTTQVELQQNAAKLIELFAELQQKITKLVELCPLKVHREDEQHIMNKIYELIAKHNGGEV